MPHVPRLPNLLFDFGGVIINIDYGRTLEAMRALSRVGTSIEFTQAAQAALFDDLETGRITPEVFRQGLRTHYDLAHATDAELDAAWNAMLLDVPLARLDYLRELRRQGYRTALLSNTNSIHIQVINEMLRREYGLENGIGDVIDRVFYSQEVGLRKPGREIFEYVLRELNWRPEETLFVEDSIQHIRTAEALGIRTLFLAPPLTLTEALPAALRAFPASH